MYKFFGCIILVSPTMLVRSAIGYKKCWISLIFFYVFVLLLF